ncbi:ABC transporter ATP-binding protein [Gemmobacter fulvus]|uniref:ABC transporter ATP-binding protein n=1 Tax=Gemmobacter fulvus TaxID=2840474 RepID=UPI002796D584|nr:ABC transporter ATP-binding protein [Gemmobacter fulvus]MDQ1850602.1 ABC transporter ATP-binding protein [Gemmobacter fulvus]
MTEPLLAVDSLVTELRAGRESIRAVDGLSFAVNPGETLGIVGESGCGKSITALSIMRLLPSIGRIASGSVKFEGTDLHTLDEKSMRSYRGDRIAMIFQEPMTSLNPVHTVGNQIAEAVRIHRGANQQDALARAKEMLDLVRIPDAARRLGCYPHELSGGMRQRVMIAMALSCDPSLLIADEPTTALDVTVQAQILKLLVELKSRVGASVVLITHDLGVVAETCQKVIVMYAGRKVEEAMVEDLFDTPLHPYTRGLLASTPRIGQTPKRRLSEIKGIVPSLRDLPKGCAFAARCSHVVPRCHVEVPEFRKMGDRRGVACHEATKIVETTQGTT